MKSHTHGPLALSVAGRRYRGLAVLALATVGLVLSQTRAKEPASHAPECPRGHDDLWYHPDYPRLGLIAIGYDQRYLPEVWPVFAKFNVVIMGGNWERWGDARAYTREDVVSGIKAASTVGTKVFQYIDFSASYPPSEPDLIGLTGWVNGVQANNWWLYNNGTSGPYAASSPSTIAINMTHFCAPDPTTGLEPYGFAAKYAHDLFFSGTVDHPRDAAPSLDGFFLDNVSNLPVNGDWNRDGTTDTGSDPTVRHWVQTGERDFYDEMHRLMPGHPQIGNNGYWPTPTSTNPFPVAPLYGVLSGGVLEGLIGASYSPDTYLDFTTTMNDYVYVMETVAQPKLEFINQENLAVDGSDPYNSTPYHAMRYGLCLTLMNDGYYTGDSVHHHSGALTDILWFDEYDGGGLGAGYLGRPVEGSLGRPQIRPRWATGTYGVWAREFTGGIAIMNPKGNGPQTITLAQLGGPKRWKRILGTQDPATNDGTDVTSDITLGDRDGIILLRQHPRHGD